MIEILRCTLTGLLIMFVISLVIGAVGLFTVYFTQAAMTIAIIAFVLVWACWFGIVWRGK